MVHDASDVPEGPVNLDSVQVRFDEQRLVSDAGLLVTATLADRLGIEELVNESVWLDPHAPRERRCIDELIARVRRAGHIGKIITRADSGFENHKQFAELDRHGVEFSIGVKLTKTIRQWTLSMPARWPWQHQFTTILNMIRALPARA